MDIHIGKPIANTQIYIVDKFMQLVPIGITGELCIAGDGVGAGYLNRPELTAEKFIDNPFGKGKLYKTGDLAYWREDGNIAYVGRNDFQVKIRGLRIELGEIENAICGIEGISQAVVVVRKNNEGRQLICAFYTGAEIDGKEVRGHISKKLPKYMLPHIITHLDTMPLTTSGKVNRKALPEVDLYSIEASVEYVAPATEREMALTAAIEEILGIEKVGLLDNFFDLGGDSLKAIELISKLDATGYHTETKTIFECDTVGELAEKLTIAEKETETFSYEGDIPATPAQMRIYTAQEMHHDSTVYNVPYAFRVAELDAHRLQMAVDALVSRHEILRTRFENKDGNIIQVINDSAPCMAEKLENDGIGAFMRPFDLSKAPLLRVGYYGNTVIIDMHHIITDGSSMPIFLYELNELYMGRILQNTPIPYKRAAVQQQDHTEDEKYWLSVFSDEVPVLELNTDLKRGQKQSISGDAIYDAIEMDLHKQILIKCKQLNITPYVFYMGAFNILLSKFSGSEDIVVGMPISGRDSKFLNTIGMFVNTIALRNQPVESKTVQTFLGEVKDNSVNAIAHQDYPYGELVKKLNINTPGRNPLFDVMFAYQSEQMTDVVFGDEKAELLPIPVTTSKYDFTFNVMPRDGDVVLMVEYCTDLFREATIRRLAESYQHILQQMLAENKPISEISAVSEKERQKLLFDFNNTAVDYPKDKCIHQLFEEQVQKTPDKVAVIACDKALTYAELHETANRIAHSLIEKGIIPGDVVAFALSRKSHLIATMFGVLKTGAAYLPVDPDYPQDRVSYMLSDSNVKYFITESNIAELLCNENIENPNIKMSSNSLCYCIYTSGSTGKPKAVQNVFDYPTVGELVACIENGDKQTVSFADVDFSEIDKLLAKNTVESISTPIKRDVGNILLAGATGFLGIHILADYLEHDTGTAYCLVRGRDKADSIQRMQELLQFYFGGKYSDMHRIEIICADLQKDLFGLSQETYNNLLSNVDMVINTAASVKHYGSYQYFYEANVETTKRLIDFCKQSGAKLIHTSTLSVSGNSFGDQFDGYVSETEKHFYESSLYIGQPLENVYARSKFEAEKAVLDAAVEGLQVNIMRMGNLTNRLSDGVFQRNYESNAFLQRVKAILDLGVFPDYLMPLYSEFTPIDEAASAIMTIARHFQSEHTVFHVNSTKVVYMDKLLEYFRALGFKMDIISGSAFAEILRQTALQSGLKYVFETFINDMDENEQLNYDSNIRIENDFTVQYLYALGFEWSDIGIEYLHKYVAHFKKIGYLS